MPKAETVVCNQKDPSPLYTPRLITTQTTIQVGVEPFSHLSTSCTYFYLVKLDTVFFVLVHFFLFFSCDYVTDEQLFSIMQYICSLVDSIPEHEVIGLSCGSELLLKRAQRSVYNGEH